MTTISWGEENPKGNYLKIKSSKLFAKSKLKLMLRASGFRYSHITLTTGSQTHFY